jgi:tetratricopeptide (TPR) repeat protein
MGMGIGNMIKFTAASIVAVSLILTGGGSAYFKWKRKKKAKKIKELMVRVLALMEKGAETDQATAEKEEKKTTRHGLEMAKWLLDQIRSLEPGHALALHYTGMYYLALGNLIEAETLCRRAERVAPDNPVIRNGLGLVFEQKGDMHRAKSYFEKSLHRSPDNSNFTQG